jgi:uncharacterized membrane protein SpoIIM required for sporulation
MKRITHALTAAVLTGASIAQAHPGHPEIPGATHGQSHIYLSALIIAGALGVTLGGSLLYRAFGRGGKPTEQRQRSRHHDRD